MFLKGICWKTFVGTWLIKIVTSAKPRQKSIASKRLVTPFDIKYLLGFASGRCPALRFPQLPTPLVLGFDLRSIHACSACDGASGGANRRCRLPQTGRS